jgi:hypothetical protein
VNDFGDPHPSRPRRIASPLQIDPVAIPLIGEIIAHGFQSESGGGTFSDESWAVLDWRWKHRRDYALYRLAVCPTPKPASPFSSVEQCIEDGLAALESEEVWGVVALLSGIITRRSGAILPDKNLAWVAEILHRRLGGPLKAISGAPRACALARLLAMTAVDKIRFREGSDAGDFESLHDYIDDAEKLVRQINEQWQPGRWISLHALREERRLFPNNVDDLAMRLGTALFNVRGAVHSAYEAFRDESGMDDLLRRAARIAFTAWRMARGRRSGKATLVASKHEVTALQRAGQAARDAGDFVTAGRLAALLLYCVPSNARPQFMSLANSVGYELRELGLSVPSWFRERQKRKRSTAEQVPQERARVETPGHSDDPTSKSSALTPINQAPLVSGETGGAVDLFNVRIERESYVDEEWKKLNAFADTHAFRGRPLERLGRVAVFLRKQHEVDGGIVATTFHLLCRYRRLRTLFVLLNSPSAEAALATRENLELLAATLREGMSTLPLFLDQNSYHNWRFGLIRLWSLLAAADCSDESTIYHLHETVLGRGLTMIRAMSGDHGETNWQAYQETLTEEDLASMLDSDVRFLHSADRGRVWGLKAAQQALTLAPSRLMFVSIALLGIHAEEFSLLGIKGSGPAFADRVKHETWHLIGQAKEVAAVETHYLRVAWPDCPGLEAIAAKILEASDALRARPEWLLLAVEPGLARVPWQDLLRRLGFTGGVALVPSAEWLIRATHPRFQRAMEDTTEVIVPVDAQRFASMPDGRHDQAALELCRELRDDLGQLRKNFRNAVFALGHGRWDRARKLTLVHEYSSAEEGEFAARNLAKFSTKEIVVLHACSGGHVVLKTLGDYDGLAAACLAGLTRAFLAPITKVAAETALCLHRHFAAPTPHESLGSRYLAALREDPRVALYTFYGLPWAPTPQRSDSNRKGSGLMKR